MATLQEVQAWAKRLGLEMRLEETAAIPNYYKDKSVGYQRIGGTELAVLTGSNSVQDAKALRLLAIEAGFHPQDGVYNDESHPEHVQTAILFKFR